VLIKYGAKDYPLPPGGPRQFTHQEAAMPMKPMRAIRFRAVGTASARPRDPPGASMAKESLALNELNLEAHGGPGSDGADGPGPLTMLSVELAGGFWEKPRFPGPGGKGPPI